jgi:hypothetical protein
MTGGADARLTTWADVVAHVAVTYGGTGSPEDGAILAIVTSPRTPTEDATAVPIEVQLLDAGWLKLTCVIGSLRNLSPAQLLASNAKSVIGVMCTRDGQLAIRQTLPLGGLAVADLDETVRSIAQLAVTTHTRLRSLAAD